MLTIYKIKLKGSNLYSTGRVCQLRFDDGYHVTFKSKGKEWKDEAGIKRHLLTCLQKGVDVSEWEIMEFTQQPSREMNEWFDEKMIMARLKYTS